jgi:hypothetical protein
MKPATWPFWTVTAVAVSLLAGASPRAQNNSGDVGFPYGDLKEVVLKGRLVPLGEEMARKYGARTAGAGTDGQWALALPEGQIYTFLDNSGYRKLLEGKPADGAVEVKARHFPRSMLLEVLQFKPVAAEGLERRFYCKVCDIRTADWGPCTCCGKEMELVAEGK